MEGGLSRFLYENGITRKEIAEYLEVTPQFISMVCSGRCRMSGQLYSRLLNNDRGWKTEPLSESDNTLEVAELVRQLKEKDAQIEYLLKTIVNLTQSVKKDGRSLYAAAL